MNPQLELVDPSTLKTSPPFSDLFPIKLSDRIAIRGSMREKGYWIGNPIVIWLERDLVVDGHTRKDCAAECGIKAYTVKQSFADEDAALEFAIACQVKRRQLTPDELAKCIRILHERSKNWGGDRKSDAQKSRASIEALDQRTPNKSGRKAAAKTAELLGTNRVTIERAQQVIKDSPDLYEAVEKGELPSINAAYEKSQERKGKGRLPKRREAMSRKATPKPPPGFSTPPPEPAPRSEVAPITNDVSPVRAKLANPQNFDIDVRLYREFKSRFVALENDVRGSLGPLGVAWMAPLRRLVLKLSSVPDPSAWKECGECHGKAGSCKKCRSSGYHIPFDKELS